MHLLPQPASQGPSPRSAAACRLGRGASVFYNCQPMRLLGSAFFVYGLRTVGRQTLLRAAKPVFVDVFFLDICLFAWPPIAELLAAPHECNRLLQRKGAATGFSGVLALARLTIYISELLLRANDVIGHDAKTSQPVSTTVNQRTLDRYTAPARGGAGRCATFGQHCSRQPARPGFLHPPAVQCHSFCRRHGRSGRSSPSVIQRALRSEYSYCGRPRRGQLVA